MMPPERLLHGGAHAVASNMVQLQAMLDTR
jgi:hypothetical protein